MIKGNTLFKIILIIRPSLWLHVLALKAQSVVFYSFVLWVWTPDFEWRCLDHRLAKAAIFIKNVMRKSFEK